MSRKSKKTEKAMKPLPFEAIPDCKCPICKPDDVFEDGVNMSAWRREMLKMEGVIAVDEGVDEGPPRMFFDGDEALLSYLQHIRTYIEREASKAAHPSASAHVMGMAYNGPRMFFDGVEVPLETVNAESPADPSAGLSIVSTKELAQLRAVNDAAKNFVTVVCSPI